MPKPTYAELVALLAQRERENARLAGDLAEALDREAAVLLESASLTVELRARLEERTATGDVLRVISSSRTSLDGVFEVIADNAARLCDSAHVAVWLVEGDLVRAVAHRGIGTVVAGAARPPDRRNTVGDRCVLDARTIAVDDLSAADAEYRAAEGARARNQRTTLGVPLLRDGAAIGCIVVARTEVRPYTPDEVQLLETFAHHAVIALENARLFSELNDSNASLKEALEQQTATAEVLATISRAPTDLQTVLDMIAGSTARLCAVERATIFLVDGSTARAVAGVNVLGRRFTVAEPGPTVPVDPTHGPMERAVATGEVVHVEDLTAVPPSDMRAEIPRRLGIRTMLVVPLMRQGAAIGAIGLTDAEVRPFTERQIALVETFADQAVIAIENARLFSELQERLEEQTATSEILGAISESPTDVQSVLDRIVSTAVRVLGADNGAVFRASGDVVAAGATQNRPAGEARPRHTAFLGTVLERNSVVGRAFVERRTVHVPDFEKQADEFPGALAARNLNSRSMLAVPLLRGEQALGAMVVRRLAARAFTEHQIKLFESFADEAVIAIENARLFQELNDGNANLREALERQTATAEVLETISRSPTSVRVVLDAIVASATRLLGGRDAVIYLAEGDGLRVAAGFGEAAAARVGIVVDLERGSVPCRAFLDRVPVHVADVLAVADEFPVTADLARNFGTRSYLATPLMRGDEAVGVLMVRRTEVLSFTQSQIAFIATFADQAVIAIENARLFQELNDSNASLKEALEQQTATAEVLATISRAPTDLQGVLDKIAESAARLCEGENVTIRLVEGDKLRAVAGTGVQGRLLVDDPASTHRALDRGTITGRAMVDRSTVHVRDIQAEPEAEFPGLRGFVDRFGQRTCLASPMLSKDVPIGVIGMFRNTVRPFSEQQVRLLETFADQAVIAIENARLFTELEARTQQLSRSVERLTALFDVSQAISGTLDIDRVLEAVLARASELAGAEGGALWELERAARVFHLRVMHGVPEHLVETWRSLTASMEGTGLLARVATDRAPVNIPDVLDANSEGTVLGDLYRASGTRATLALPLLREDEVLGALVVRRSATGAFDPDTVALLQTFATQSALAIQNARLFQELAEKSRQLEETSRHKSEFLANMSHELRTPLNAIIGFTEVLLEKYFGDVNEKQEDYLKDVLSSGQHLLSLINDILDLSKVEAGRMELELGTFDLGHVLEAGLVMLKERASKKGIDLSLVVAPDTGRIEADERKVKQVLFNLLTNAVKFTPEGGKITVSARRADGHAEVAVSDTGAGIGAEDQAKVFEEFGQARNQQGQTEGTGLGLALVKRFVDLHGGSVRVKSTVGKGSTFTVSLPLRRAIPS